MGVFASVPPRPFFAHFHPAEVACVVPKDNLTHFQHAGVAHLEELLPWRSYIAYMQPSADYNVLRTALHAELCGG